MTAAHRDISTAFRYLRAGRRLPPRLARRLARAALVEWALWAA